VQGHVLQMPSVRAAMGLPSGPPKAALTADAETMSEQKAQNQQVPLPILASGQTSEGTPNGQPISTKGNLPRGQPVDMEKLLTVSPAVQAMAARATDATAVIVKVGSVQEGSVSHTCPPYTTPLHKRRGLFFAFLKVDSIDCVHSPSLLAHAASQ
jgi:hypothetical protein